MWKWECRRCLGGGGISTSRHPHISTSLVPPQPYLRRVRFSSLTGHAALKATLINNVREGRVAHAQLFLGPRGSGTLPLALAYARYLFCQQPGAADACGDCPSCQQMDHLAHPDLNLAFPIFLGEKGKSCSPYLEQWREAVLDEPYLDDEVWRRELNGENKQLTIGVDIAQEVNRQLSLKAYRGGWKVMLIWLPEAMNLQAANKLLKVLEEPEERTVFLLVAHQAEHLLPTILSRVQLVKVPALTEADVLEELQVRFPDLGEAEARAIAIRSEGDVLEATTMAEKGEDELFLLFRDWLRACYARKVDLTSGHMEVFNKLGREKQKALMRYALYLMRQCVLQWQGAHPLVVVAGEERDFVEKFATLVNERNIPGIREELEIAHYHLERNANPKVLFMDLSYRMMGLLRA